MTNALLLKKIDKPNSDIFEEWRFLIGKKAKIIYITILGDAFFEIPKSFLSKNFGIFFLNTGTGSFNKIAESVAGLSLIISNSNSLDSYVCSEKVEKLKKKLGALGDSQIYSYKQMPFLGGPDNVDNYEKTEINVHFGLTGELYRQVKDLPQGTSISKININ